MDKTWAEIGRLKDEDGDTTMNELSKVMNQTKDSQQSDSFTLFTQMSDHVLFL